MLNSHILISSTWGQLEPGDGRNHPSLHLFTLSLSLLLLFIFQGKLGVTLEQNVFCTDLQRKLMLKMAKMALLADSQRASDQQ